MEEDDVVIRVGNSLSTERDAPTREKGLQARGAYKVGVLTVTIRYW